MRGETREETGGRMRKRVRAFIYFVLIFFFFCVADKMDFPLFDLLFHRF